MCLYFKSAKGGFHGNYGNLSGSATVNAAVQSIEAVDLFGKVSKGMLKDLPQLKRFIEHCYLFGTTSSQSRSVEQMIAVFVDHLSFHHKCLKQYTFSQILFREKTISTYHLKSVRYSYSTTEIHRPSSKRSKQDFTLTLTLYQTCK